MGDAILSNLFGQQHFTGADHTQNVTILSILGGIGIAVLLCIALGMIVRQLSLLAIYIATKIRRQPAVPGAQKKP